MGLAAKPGSMAPLVEFDGDQHGLCHGQCEGGLVHGSLVGRGCRITHDGGFRDVL